MTDTIDPEKLEEAIKDVSERLYSAAGLRVIAAARAHLSTLPRFKEVEVEAFAVVDNDGEPMEVWLVQKNARLDAEEMNGTVVRLTGTAKVRA